MNQQSSSLGKIHILHKKLTNKTQISNLKFFIGRKRFKDEL